MGSRRLRLVSRFAAVFAVPVLLLSLLGAVASGEDAPTLPDTFQALASASGLSIVSFKQPNPLPVGPGAFLTFEVPEVEGALANDGARARTSLLYPGPAIAGINALLCTAGFPPSCGQAPPPVLAEAEWPSTKDAKLASDDLALRDPSAPLSAGAANGEAHVTAASSMSTATLSAARVDPPDPARKAILDALTATLKAIPGAARVDDPALFSFAGGTVSQRVFPAGEGKVRADSSVVINGIHLLAGAVTIKAVKVTSFVVTDGATVQDAGSTTDSSGVLVAGFPATFGPEGLTILGQSDHGQSQQALTGVAQAISDAVHLAVGKLGMEIRDGRATTTLDKTSAAADGLRIHLASARLTDASPPQVPQLCTVTSAIQDPLAAGGLRLPPICAVPDVTGTSDTYDFQLGRAGATLTAVMNGSLTDAAGLGGTDQFGNPLTTGGGAGDTGSVGGVLPRHSARRAALPGLGRISFLAFEARWLGKASGRIGILYLVIAAGVTLLLLIAKAVLRAAAQPARRSSR